MENNENKVTEPVSNETKPEGTNKMYSQEDLNNIVAKESKKAIEKVLKDLGVENVKSAKDGLSELKKIQDDKKTELEKALERIEEQNKKIATYESEAKSRDDIDSITSILKKNEIDTGYAKTIKKLMTDEVNEESVIKTIEEELPVLIQGKNKKTGLEKKEARPSSSTSDYLKKKYKDNPYFRL